MQIFTVQRIGAPNPHVIAVSVVYLFLLVDQRQLEPWRGLSQREITVSD